ncbi:ABC transporter permease [Neobacillus mesonae]|nr:ABC transporter permease [Neobacillus mesonae]
MKIIGYELKKIFNPKVLIFLALFHFIFFIIRFDFYFEHFPNGRPSTDIHRVTIQMLEQYGDHMDAGEFEDFKHQLEEAKQEADQIIRSDPYFKKYRVVSYEDYERKASEGILPFEVSRYIFDDEARGKIFWEISGRKNLIEQYEYKSAARTNDLSDAQLEKVNQYEQDGTFTSIFSSELMDNYTTLLGYMLVLIVVSGMFLVIPLYIKDRNNGVIFLQYTSKAGRRHFFMKWVAAIVAVTILFIIQISTFFLFYSDEIKSVFYPNAINSYFGGWWGPYWYDLSFIEFIIITIALLYVLLLLFVTLTALISSLFRNYVTIIGALVPFVIWLLSPFFDVMLVKTASIYYPVYLQPVLYGVFILVIVLFFLRRWRRERTGDLI